MSITISSKNQIVIPSAVRKEMGLGKGDLLVVSSISKNAVTLKKAPTPYDMVGLVEAEKTEPVDRIRKVRKKWR